MVHPRRRIRREFGNKHKTNGWLYAASFDATHAGTTTAFNYALRLIRLYRKMGDLAKELQVVRDINKILDYNWNDHKTGSRYDYECYHFNGEMLVSDRISRGTNHNLKTSAGLELDNMTRAGIGGRLINWVGIATGATEPTRGTTTLIDEVERFPTNPDGWLTPSSDLLFTGVICGTNTQSGTYKSAGGYTGNASDDILGWVCLLPESQYIEHEAGSTIMVWSHVDEEISLV